MTQSKYIIHDQSVVLDRQRLLVVFGLLSIALLITYIDQQSIGVVLPTIGNELNSSSTIVWAGTSSMIANTAFQTLYGRVSDILGRKVIMITSLCLLGVADLLCGFAKSGPQLYAYRGIAGVANGGIMALSMMIVSDITTLETRGKYQGILGSFVGLGSTIGPFIATGFTRSVGWQGTFYFVSPLAVLVGVLLFFLLPPQAIPKERLKTKLGRIDYLGIFFSSIGTILLLVPISGVRTQFNPDSAMFISMITLGSILLVLFILHEWKWAGLPIFPFHLMKNPALAAMMAQNFLIGIVYFSLLYFLPIFFQAARQASLLDSALLLIPLVVPQSISSALAGIYMSHKKRYGEVIWLGYVLWVVSSAVQCLFSRTFPLAGIIVVLAIEGTAVGLIFQPTLVAAQAHSPKKDRAVVIGARNFTRAFGGAAGLAIASAIYSNSLVNHIPTGIPTAIAVNMKSSIFVIPDVSDLSDRQKNLLFDAYVDAARSVFYMWAGAMGLCLLLMVFVNDKGLTRNEETEKDEQNDSVPGSESLTSKV
ncbi:hypothetical protein TMatcc_002495 [Talaromyces marneffei ATCC 18224]|uniref:Major facilitator superfamily (MFS) profile domain-containing protein n=1 Tax=Talaromyces marneffei (strain ATCC 18224 / CBS 334.59 / QM 7333) TaxID=441960 RepID=B6QKC6_TALMQ|nr:uncharacterized protein EYB26_006363 [Talaromyces marneffei]EEA23620.1 conserved hypothetical protein [Talaromyces marneffei ATCC 18224]KAE8552449.1 hypothetical protein EYB25_006343 [Talaromyces marneffei]QGA18678.1 hypothetical protein EYB26_006363 [Talaromyces marneffei]